MILSQDELKRKVSSLKPVKSGNNFIIDCPNCGQRECSISINKPNHPSGCYRQNKCGWKGNIYSLKDFGIAILKSERILKIDDNFEKIELKVFKKEEESVSLQDINMPISYKRVFNSDYLNGRGWIDKDYQYWEAGSVLFGSLKDYVIFPIYQNNGIKAYVSRLARDKKFDKESKYKNSLGETFRNILGGFDKVSEKTKTIILCEGYFDIININRLLDLYDCEEIKTCCTFGAKLSDNQIKSLQSKNISNIILLYDNDVISKIKSISFTLAIYFNTSVALIEDEKVDAGDCDENQLLQALENKQDPVSFYLNRL